MNQDTATGLRRGRSRRRRRPLLWCSVALVVALTLAVSGAFWRLTNGPLRIDGMSERVASAIAGSIGPGWRVALSDSALELDAEQSLALRVGGLDIFNPEGALVVRAPLAVVSLDTWSLLRLSVQPRAIEFRDLQMTALVHRNGSIAFAASDSSPGSAVVPHTLPSVDAAAGHVSPISASVASIFEMTHRGANTLAEFADDFRGRLDALSRVHSAVFHAADEEVSIAEIVDLTFDPYQLQGQSRVVTGGPAVMLTREAGTTLALCLHELATNASKYGALSTAGGHVSITWSVGIGDGGRRLAFAWEESGGPTVTAPTRTGFGSRMIERVLAQHMRGTAKIEYRSTGVVFVIDAPL